jgi:hypothetical protein
MLTAPRLDAVLVRRFRDQTALHPAPASACRPWSAHVDQLGAGGSAPAAPHSSVFTWAVSAQITA